MFRKPSLSAADEEKLKIAEKEMLRVSPTKPLGYLEKGEYKGTLINPRCIHYVPEELIDELMKKNDIYILSPKYDEEKKIEWKGTHAQNPRIILLDAKEALAGNRTMVFHKEALKKLLECNKIIVLSIINRKKFFEEVAKGTRPTKENSIQNIDDSVVIAFVELVGRENFFNNAKALIDAAFADTDLFFQNTNWRKIKLTKELNQYFIQEHFPQWVGIDWKSIEKEYKDANAFIRSSESKALVKDVISQLAKEHGTLQDIDKINEYIKQYPQRRLSQIILSKISNTSDEKLTVRKRF